MSPFKSSRGGGGGNARKRQQPRSGGAAQSSSDVGLRERLIQQLVDGSLECLICLDKVRQKHAVFDCQECYQVFHIHCIKKWSKTAKNEGRGERIFASFQLIYH